MGENKYSEIIKNYTFEQLVYERSILDKQKENLYIQDKELKEEFKRRLELNRGKSLNNKEEFSCFIQKSAFALLSTDVGAACAKAWKPKPWAWPKQPRS